MRRPVLLVLAAAGALAIPGAASADVYVKVPRAFLGGPIWMALPATAPVAEGRPSAGPPPGSDSCRGEDPDDCVVVGPGAEIDVVPLPGPGPGGVGAPFDGIVIEDDPVPEEDTPVDDADGQGALEIPAMPVVPPTASDLASAFGGLVYPAAAAWLAWQRPTMRWRAVPGARRYNVQVFRGERRVLNAWSRDTRLRVPAGVLRQGRSYSWSVWSETGTAATGRVWMPVGRSVFALTLRPRIVFRTPGGRAGTVGEVRPHIPFATLRLSRPGALAMRVPRSVTLDRRGRFTLPISSRSAERLGAVLTDRGPTPPVGLRGPGL